MKERLDIVLVKRGLAKSRENAKEYIKQQKVYVAGKCETKASTQVDEDSQIEVKGETLKYVSRGGLKLEKAIHLFSLDLKDKVCMDIGASTGGFTDCMLFHGAKKVYAIDVGRDQLDEKLRQDSRVISMEQTNVRYLKKEHLSDCIDFVSIDVSFISLTKVIPVLVEILDHNAEVVCLVKPQFEAGKEHLNKKGVVKEKKVQVEVLETILSFLEQLNFQPKGIGASPIKGPEGNIEFLIYFQTNKSINSTNMITKEQIINVVNSAHLELDH